MSETIEALKNDLFYNPRHASRVLSDEEAARADAYAEEYKAYLSAAKTEREAVTLAVEMAEKNGFRPFDRNAP